jgi:hypothetical protein
MGHTGFLMIDGARQITVDFAKQPELLKQTSGRSEVATSPEDDKLAKLKTNCSSGDATETRRLPRAAQLPAVPGLPLVEAPATISSAVSFEADTWTSTPLLRRPSDPLSNRTKFLIATAVAVLPAGYFIFGNSDRPVDIAVAPQTQAIYHSVEPLPLREAEATSAETRGITIESKAEPDVQTASPEPPARLAKKPTDSAIEATSPQTLPDKELLAAGRDDSTCLPSASAVRQNHPGAWPSWTLRAPGHEGTRCWYPATRTKAEAEARSARAGGVTLEPNGRDTCFPSASAVLQNHPGAWPSWTMRAPGHEGIRCWYPQREP